MLKQLKILVLQQIIFGFVKKSFRFLGEQGKKNGRSIEKKEEQPLNHVI